MGGYQGGSPSGSVPWLDYLVTEKGDRATVVYMPDFRNLAIKKSYEGGFYADLFRPGGSSATLNLYFAQTGIGALLNYVPVPKGSYDERIRILLDQPKASDPAMYRDLLARLM